MRSTLGACAAFDHAGCQRMPQIDGIAPTECPTRDTRPRAPRRRSSRVESGEHFAEDVIAGAAIGIVGSLIFTRPYHGVEVTPVADAGVYGVALQTTW